MCALIAELASRVAIDFFLNVQGAQQRIEGIKPIPRLSELACKVLDSAEVTIANLMDDYTASIHPWIPILDQPPEREEKSIAQASRRDQISFPLSILAALLLFSILSTASKLHLEYIQIGLLIAVYECGHGLAKQAHLTVSSCAAVMDLIDMETKRQNNRSIVPGEILRHRTSIIILDRMIAFSTPDYNIPLACPATGPFSKHPEAALTYVVPLKPIPYVRQVALVAGRVIEYIHALKHRETLHEEYALVDEVASSIVTTLIKYQREHSWYMCDAIAMALLALIALHQAQMHYCKSEDAERTQLALQTSTDMVWDMCESTIAMVESKDVSHYPFAGLCAVFRSGVLVAGGLGGEQPPANEPSRLLLVLHWFSTRWCVGIEYVRAVEDSSNLSK
ncbi:hypothetical protein CC78DRAFT_567807 [Lojkania enalia]|uniref:Transcription factor domain-containing protein n=1 Tax=Lojkania enalia TaxID=147567 RepID=A0A9P4KCP6_9PLEO|nr:hypothetical protein CC78DRAFT_567807 [Didymosphaeria enalia]